MSVLTDFLGVTNETLKTLGVANVADYFIQKNNAKIALETARSKNTIEQLNASNQYLQLANQQLMQAQQLQNQSVFGSMGTAWVKYALLAGAAFAVYKLVK